MASENDQEQKIIAAAITCINEAGLQGVTVRQIAEEAGVNVAAINYYFRSKERLIDLAMEQTLHNAFDDWVALLDDEGLDLRAQLRDILDELTRGAISFPGISRAHLYGPLMEGRDDTPFAEWFRSFLDRLLAESRAAHPSVPEERIRASLVQLLSAAMFPFFVPTFFQGLLPKLTFDEAQREAYVDHLLDTFFASLKHSKS